MTDFPALTAEQKDWLARIEGAGGKCAVPAWLDVSLLPQLAWASGAPLGGGTEKLLGWLRKQLKDGPSTDVTALGGSLDGPSRSALVGAVLRQWAALTPANQPWVVELAVAWADDGIAAQLAEIVRDLAAERKPQRAIRGIEALARIGSDLALLHVRYFAGSGRTPTQRHHAAEIFAGAARQRQLSTEELADRTAPTLGFDRTGTQRLDFGGRSWTARLTCRPSVEIVDAQGKVLKGPPKPSKADDPEKAARSLAHLRFVKSELKTFLAVHSERLERAMLSQRRWPAAEWRSRHLEHPILRLMSQSILWGACEADLRRLCFRVAEDFSLADDQDDAIDPRVLERMTIGVVHPLHLAGAEPGTWSDIFRDYELTPHIEQLGRPTFTPTDEEKRAGAVERYLGWLVDARQLLYQLPQRGWEPAAPVEFGLLLAHTRVFAWADVTAVLHHGPVLPGRQKQTMETVLGELAFVRGPIARLEPWDERILPRVSIETLDAIVFSEAMRDVDHLARSGRGYDANWRRRLSGRSF